MKIKQDFKFKTATAVKSDMKTLWLYVHSVWQVLVRL